MSWFIAIAALGIIGTVILYAFGICLQNIAIGKQEVERMHRELDNRQRLLDAERRNFEAQKRGER
jgi:hypothetical protein